MAAIFPDLFSAPPIAGSRAGEAPYLRTLRGYSRLLVGTDLVATVVAVVAGMGFSLRTFTWSVEHFGSNGGVPLATLIVAGWMAALAHLRSRDRRVVGVGAQEFARIGTATWWTFALIAIVSFVLGLSAARNHVVVTFPLGLALLIAARGAWRVRLRAERARGRALASVLVVGTRANVDALVLTFQNLPHIGYGATAVCVPDAAADAADHVSGVPVVGTPEQVAALAAEFEVDIVAVTGSDSTTADYVRSLGWTLNPQGIGLMIASALADVAGPRIVTTPVTGARLVHVDAPEFTGPKYWVKTAADTIVASLAVVILLPAFAAIALAVKLDSPGPAFFKQVRIGRNGRPFLMYKFRSMVADADTRLADLLRQSDGNGLIFKMKADPRVTRVGRFLRRTSLDELPQLFNVAKTDMSMVGPRPPLEREVAEYRTPDLAPEFV